MDFNALRDAIAQGLQDALTDALNNAAQAAPQPAPAPAPAPARAPRNYAQPPDHYDGNPATYETFRHLLKVYVISIPDAKDKIVCAISFLSKGDADAWAQGYMQVHANEVEAGTITWEAFLSELDGRFQDRNQASLARKAITKLYQGKMTADAFFVKFDDLRTRGGLTNAAQHDMLLIDYLETQLDAGLVLAVQNSFEATKASQASMISMFVTMGILAQNQADPQIEIIKNKKITYEEFRKLAKENDEAVRRYGRTPAAPTKSEPRRFTPATQSPSAHAAPHVAPTVPQPARPRASVPADDPMDVDHVRRADKRTCYGCKEVGHIYRNCPHRTRTTLRRLDEEGTLDWDELRRMLKEKDEKSAQKPITIDPESFHAPQ